MPNQHNTWHRRQHTLDRTFPYVMAALALVAIYSSWQIVKATPQTEEQAEPSGIIKEQLAILDANMSPEPSDIDDGKATVTTNGPINLRIASINELETLPGIGPKKAEQIVALRDTDQVKSVSDLQKVKGIGPKLYAEIEGKLVWE